MAFREFVRDWLRSYPAEAARALWREDIYADRILFGHASYFTVWQQKLLFTYLIQFVYLLASQCEIRRKFSREILLKV